LLLFEIFDLATLVSVDLPEQRQAAVESEVGYGDDMCGYRFGAIDVEATGNAAIIFDSIREWLTRTKWTNPPRAIETTPPPDAAAFLAP
jgi:hypothetical protein